MKVTALPRDPGPAAWNSLLPAAATPQVVSEDISADWIVIGAGFAGLAATRRLAQHRPEDRIVVLDATRVGEGPAGRNSGFMIDLPHDLSSQNYGGASEQDRFTIADNRMAMAYAKEMVEEFDLPQEAFDPSGKINGAATQKGHRHNLDYAAHLDQLGESYEMLDAAEMTAITGSSYYRSGLRTPGTVVVQPAIYVRGLARGLTSNRVSFYENSPVTDLRRDGVWRAETPGGTITAPRVILTVNGHLKSFGFHQRNLVHVHTYASMTRALTAEESATLGGEPRWGITPADPLGSTIRRISGTGGDRIVVRNRFTYDPDLHPGDDWEARIVRDHDRSFEARFPMLKGVSMQYRWGGRLCLSLNGVQVVDELAPGLFAGCCQNGLGTVRGTLAGMLAADLGCGKTSDALSRATAQRPPKRLPPLDRIGAPLRLRYGEWRAGREL